MDESNDIVDMIAQDLKGKVDELLENITDLDNIIFQAGRVNLIDDKDDVFTGIPTLKAIMNTIKEKIDAEIP